MKIMLRAVMVAVSIGTIGSAHAGEGESTAANTLFTEIPAVWLSKPRCRTSRWK